jgi:hypothetical protein
MGIGHFELQPKQPGVVSFALVLPRTGGRCFPDAGLFLPGFPVAQLLPGPGSGGQSFGTIEVQPPLSDAVVGFAFPFQVGAGDRTGEPPNTFPALRETT